MKLLLLCLAVLMCAAGCAAPTAQMPQSSVETTTAVTTTTAAVLPEGAEAMTDAASVEAALGLIIDLPAQAENATYHMDGDVVYTGFVFEGTQYYWILGKTLPEQAAPSRRD